MTWSQFHLFWVVTLTLTLTLIVTLTLTLISLISLITLTLTLIVCEKWLLGLTICINVMWITSFFSCNPRHNPNFNPNPNPNNPHIPYNPNPNPNPYPNPSVKEISPSAWTWCQFHQICIKIIILSCISPKKIFKNHPIHAFQLFSYMCKRYYSKKSKCMKKTICDMRILTKTHLRVMIRKNFQHQVKSPIVWTFLA